MSFQATSAFLVQRRSIFVSQSTKEIINTGSSQLVMALKLAPGGASAAVDNLYSPQQSSTNMIRAGLAKNANVFWAATTGLAVWFLFFHTPTFWHARRIQRDTLLAIHIVAAGSVYIACVHNCLMTPSLHAATRFLHRWVGRIGLVSGLVSFSLGAFLAWSRLGRVGEGSTTLGFAIPITIGGFLQLQCEYKGFRAIRSYKNLQYRIDGIQINGRGKCKGKECLETLLVDQKTALKTHIGYMLNLFVCACGIPAGIRLAEFLARGDEGILGIIALTSVIGFLQYLAGRYVRKVFSTSFDSSTKSS